MKRAALFLAVVLALIVPAQAAGLEVGGKSACLMEVATGTVLYEKNPTEPLAPASVTKVMTMLLIMEAIDSGKIGWDDMVTASETAAAKGGSQVYLKAGETMSVRDMLKSIAVSSANDCACAMAEHLAGSESAFVELMNRRAQELGMTSTHFVNCTGLDDAPEASEHRTSAGDIAIMSRELLSSHPDITKFTTIWMDTIRDGAFGLSNTNKMVRFYNGATGLKTGFTSGAGYCLSASAQRDGMQLVAVVMGAESSKERFAACKQLLDYGFANYALYTPELQGEARVQVSLGREDTVNAVLRGNNAILVEKGERGGIQSEMSLEETVSAPVSQGEKLGKLILRTGDRVLAELPLVAEKGVERVNWADLFIRILKRVAMAG